MLSPHAVAVRHRDTGAADVRTKAKTPAAADAERILDTVWRGRGIPVDPFWIADRLGIRVVEADLPPNLSGALMKDHGQDPQIVLNAADHLSRQRFSCAYELAHFTRRRADPDAYEYVDSRDIFSPPGGDAEQAYASEFAESLLMPAEDVRLLHEQGWTEVDMPVLFRVARDAVHYRLKNLGLE